MENVVKNKSLVKEDALTKDGYTIPVTILVVSYTQKSKGTETDVLKAISCVEGVSLVEANYKREGEDDYFAEYANERQELIRSVKISYSQTPFKKLIPVRGNPYKIEIAQRIDKTTQEGQNG